MLYKFLMETRYLKRTTDSFVDLTYTGSYEPTTK